MKKITEMVLVLFCLVYIVLGVSTLVPTPETREFAGMIAFVGFVFGGTPIMVSSTVPMGPSGTSFGPVVEALALLAIVLGGLGIVSLLGSRIEKDPRWMYLWYFILFLAVAIGASNIYSMQIYSFVYPVILCGLVYMLRKTSIKNTEVVQSTQM